MHRFAYRRPESVDAAIQAARAGQTSGPPVQAPGQFIAGGTNMTDYMALDVMRPDVLVDINRLPAARYGRYISSAAAGSPRSSLLTITPAAISACSAMTSRRSRRLPRGSRSSAAAS